MLVLAACTEASAPRTLKVGVVGALTGPNAAYGVATQQGVDLAAAQINRQGKKVEVIHFDDQGRPEEAKAAAQRLITQERVDLLIGEATSDSALAMAPIAQRGEVPMIAPSATHPAITEVGDFVFRACFIDRFQGRVMARYAIDTLGKKRLAILRDADSEYSSALAESFREEIGGALIADEVYGAGDRAFSAVVERILSKSPEAIYVPGYHREVTKIALAAGGRVPLLGGDGWDTIELRTAAGAAIEGAHYTTHYHGAEPRPEVGAFSAAYRERYNERPSAIAALGYDAARLAFDAWTRSGGGGRAGIRRALAATRGFAGVTGTISFDEKRNASKPAIVVRISGGRPEFVARIESR